MLRLVLCGAMLWPALGPRAPARAIAVVKKLGGEIVRAETVSGKPTVRVILRRTKVTDAGLKELKELKSLTRLDLGYTEVTDLGLKDLRELKDLDHTKVTDLGAKELQKALPKCEIRK